MIVASFDPTHEEFVLACIAAGKRVLCEKPLATTAEACLHVVEAEVAAGRRLVTVGFMRRCDPALRGTAGLPRRDRRPAARPLRAPQRPSAGHLHVRDADHQLLRA